MSNEVLADDTLLRVSHLAGVPRKPGILGISRASFYRLVSSGNFPKPVRPLPGVVAWRAGDVRQWIASRASN